MAIGGPIGATCRFCGRRVVARVSYDTGQCSWGTCDRPMFGTVQNPSYRAPPAAEEHRAPPKKRARR